MSVFERDFDALVVGERFMTAGRTVGEADIAASRRSPATRIRSTSTPRWAAGSRFGEQIAHGLLVLSFASGLMPFDPERDRRAAPRGATPSSSSR